MLDKKYHHQEVERDKYQFWKENDFFKAGDLTKEPFSMVIPPPNVTGKLHLGHAWNTTLQDIIARYKRMNGYDVLWLPGMDHAGIATQSKIDKKLVDLGLKPRGLSRDEWLKYAWEWKDEYAHHIHEQWAKLGLSLDYSKERFTLDEGLSKAVNEVFITLYKEGLIYKGEKIINWDPVLKTALSNEEVIYKNVEGYFYYLRYYLEGSDDYLLVATTRPETIFGDVALAVNPKDERYQKMIGKKVILPIVGKLIPVIADDYADPGFQTGIVKITPAHDPNDFEVGNRHNLERVVVMNEDGTMNEKAGIYNGLDRFICREELIKELSKRGLLEKQEKMSHAVGHSERTDVMIEPYLSSQWFVRMSELAKTVLERQNSDDKINFIPHRFLKVFKHWNEIAHDWCISRQLWWGHRIPAWYKNDQIYVGETAPDETWRQDNDVLDTWFSSALWPFSTLGWPNNTSLLERYFPTSVLVTAYDIIFFWVCRMAFQSFHFMDQRPFNDCLIHGLIRDKNGQKMSKSLGNGIDPMEVIDEYGTDSLRFFLSTSVALGQDLRYDEEKVKATWNFINKLWNASRYVLMKLEGFNEKDYELKDLKLEDKWILTKLEETIKETVKDMDKYHFNNVGKKLYTFVWNDFCDWYIELSKQNFGKTTQSVLLYTLTSILKLLHPFIPYVTEEIYQKLPVHEKSIMISSYPKAEKKYVFKEERELLDKVIIDIIAIRNMKSTNEIPKDSYVMIDSELLNIYLSQLKIDQEHLIKDKRVDYLAVNYHSELVDFTYFYRGNKIDQNKLMEEIESLKNSIQRREGLLANQNYVSKAPIDIVELDRSKLQEEKIKLASLENKLDM